MESGVDNLPTDKVIFFDGVCNLCNASVDYVIRIDRRGIVKFASLQGQLASDILPRHGLDPKKLDSILFLESGRVYRESSAVLRITKYLGGLWPAARLFLLVPRFIRDGVYKFVARNRYRWFGKADSCRLPTAAEAARFID